jgi:DNA-binding GntR family transcriptional regulator
MESCGNRRLAGVISNFKDQGHRVRLLTLKTRTKPYESTEDHRALLEAVRRRDAEKAYQIHRNHRIRVNAQLLDLLDRLGFGES